MILEMPFELFDLQEQDEDGEWTNQMMEYLRSNNDSEFNMPKKKPAKKKTKNNLESFMEDENNGN
jgi:hypothetical protein